jgi:MFS family permease
MESSSTKPLSIPQLLAVFSLFSFMAEFTILVPAIQVFAMRFPETDITNIMLANTITGLVGIPVGIIAGGLVNRIGFRPMAIVGSLLMIVGVFPFFTPDLQEYWPVIFSRFVVGIGYGMVFPLGGAMFILHFQGKQRAKFLGAGAMVQFAFAILFSIVAGYLATLEWNFVFLSYFLSIVPFVFILLFLPESKGLAQEAARKEAEAARAHGGIREKIPHTVWLYILVFGFFCWMTYIVLNFATPIIVVERAIGDSVVAGWVSSSYCLGAALAGIAFGKTVSILKTKVFAICAFIVAAGGILLFVASNPAMLYVGAILTGFGGCSSYTAAQNSVGNITPKSRVPFTNGLFTAGMNIASFLVAYWIVIGQILLPQMGTAAPEFIDIIIMVIVGIVCLFIPFKALLRNNESE